MLISKVRITNLCIDDEDRDVEKYKWRLSGNGYAIRGPMGLPGNKYTIRLHRIIASRILGRELKLTEFIDHINGDKLDNRRSNLRLATKSQNGMNLHPRKGCTSRFIGVSFSPAKKRWVAYINKEGRRLQVGKYKIEEEAAWMRDQYAIALHGGYARLNFDYEPVPSQAIRQVFTATDRILKSGRLATNGALEPDIAAI